MTAPPADRLYGRRRGHTLRARQQRLLDEILPRLRYDPADARWISGFDACWLEVGFGGGEHALAQSIVHPHAALIACDVFVNGICTLLGRLVPEGAEATAPLPRNLRLWDQDARTLLRTLPAASLDGLFLLFPDPWPKTRHAGRRFVNPDTIALAARVLKPGGTWRIATDDPTYQDWVRATMSNQPLFTAAEPTAERPAEWPPTRYEAKAIRAGRRPLYWEFARRQGAWDSGAGQSALGFPPDRPGRA